MVVKTVDKEIADGWLEVDINKFWVLCRNGLWAGLVIGRFPDFVAGNRSACFHIHFYSQDESDIDYVVGDAPTFDEAKLLAESYYDEHVLSTAIDEDRLSELLQGIKV